MGQADEMRNPVRAKAVLVNPDTMTVLWMNESASAGIARRGATRGRTLSLVDAVPVAEALGLVEVIADVSATGVAQHVGADLISTPRGNMGFTISIYRLPDGTVLLITEDAWQYEQRGPQRGASGRHGRHIH